MHDEDDEADEDDEVDEDDEDDVQMTTVGFEPTPLARPAPKAGALDHSATLSSNRRKLASYSF